jgi:hypothetical protein
VTVFGIDPVCVYGTDEDKNKKTHIKWKDMCKFLPPRQISEIKKAGKYDDYMTGREFLQYFGTNVCRALDDECWTRRCHNDILTDGSDIAIIQDCRFANEVKSSSKLKEKYGIDVKVVKFEREVGFDLHDSETGLKGVPSAMYDLVIDNQHMTIKEKNLEILDYLYECGWFSEHLPLESKE